MLTSAKPTAPPPQQLAQVRLEDLRPDPHNPRADVGDITDLAASMRVAGLLTPIIARRVNATQTAGFYVVAGHRRLAAARHLGWASVPVLVRRYMPPDEVLAAMLIENGQRAGLDPIEEARALARLKETAHLSDAELARRVGRSQPTVSARLALLALAPEEQEALRAKETTLQAAAARGRVAAGTDRPGAIGADRAWHFSPGHDLEVSARARCKRLDHRPGRRIGGVACGACWESVIRSDELDHLRIHAKQHDQCRVCNRSSPTGGTA